MKNCIEIKFGETYDWKSMLFIILDLFHDDVEAYRIADSELSAYLYYSKNTPLFEKKIYTYNELIEKQKHRFEIDFATIFAFPSMETTDIRTGIQLVHSSCIYGITIVDYNEYYVFSHRKDIMDRIEAQCCTLTDIRYRIGNLKNLNILQPYISRILHI